MVKEFGLSDLQFNFWLKKLRLNMLYSSDQTAPISFLHFCVVKQRITWVPVLHCQQLTLLQNVGKPGPASSVVERSLRKILSEGTVV